MSWRVTITRGVWSIGFEISLALMDMENALMRAGANGQAIMRSILMPDHKKLYAFRMRIPTLLIALALGMNGLAPALAQDREVPYWASISSPEVRMRVGPSRDFPIEWVYKRDGLPVKIVRVQESWRLVQDPEGAQGWMAASLLSLERTAIVVGEGVTPIRTSPSDTSDLKWNVEPGVVGKLGKCTAGWCEFDASGRAGWVLKERLWGAGEP